MDRKKICIVGAFGKLGQYRVRHALDRGYQVVGVCRAQSVDKLEVFDGRMTVIAGATNDREVIKHAVAGCGGVLTVLVPWGVQHCSTGTAQAVLDFADPGARLIFSCGWHISKDGKDVYSRTLTLTTPLWRRGHLTPPFPCRGQVTTPVGKSGSEFNHIFMPAMPTLES